MVDFHKPNDRNFIHWDFTSRRGGLLFHDEHVDHIRDDSAIDKRQPGKICRNQEAGSGLERDADARSPVALTRS